MSYASVYNIIRDIIIFKKIQFLNWLGYNDKIFGK